MNVEKGKTMDIILKNGKIITAHSSYFADLWIRDQKIQAIGLDLEISGAKIIDVRGQYILPGAIDAHTHLEFSAVNGICSSDDYFAGTRAAACGGVTTVFDFVTQQKGEGIREAAARRDRLCAPKACVDYAFHVALTDLRADVLEEFAHAAQEGLTSYKLYMVYRECGLMMSDAEIYQALRRSGETGTLIEVHAENQDIIEMNIEQFRAAGTLAPWYHYLSRPEAVEADADLRVIHWAKALHVPLYIVHLANAEGVQAVREARREGYEIYAETCPQYLAFTSEVYKRPDACDFVCSPPMKGKNSQDALWQGIRDGTISTIATDHCPFSQKDKERGREDFTKIPNGCMGIETMYPYMLSAANTGRISFGRAVELCAENPARIFGCAAKGRLEPGMDADLVLFDPAREFTITQQAMHSAGDYTIWEGMKLSGRIMAAYSRGRLVYADGEFLGEAGWGAFVRCQPNV